MVRSEVNDAPVRGHIRRVGYRRVSHGLFLPVREGARDDEEFLRDLRAWLLVLPDTAVFTHVTAARLLGWQLPRLPEHTPVFAAVTLGAPRPRREGLICSRLRRNIEGGRAQGMPVDAPEEVLLRAARDLGVLDLVVMLDSGLRLGHIDVPRLRAVLDSGRPGVGVLRAAFALSDWRRESAGESLLAVFHAAIDVPVESQVTLRDDHGRSLGRVDLLVCGTSWVHEYDGAVHRDADQHRTDLRRERAWGQSPYRRKEFVLDDLINHAGVVMHEIDRSLGRAHQARRLRRWRTLVRESLYDEVGRERVQNRWHRAMGIVQWS